MADAELLRHQQIWARFTNLLFWGALGVAVVLVVLLLTVVNGVSWLIVLFGLIVIGIAASIVRSLLS